MKIDKKSSFAFLVLAYNHEEWILDHLESIKYLVERYGHEIEVDFIVSDDCSNDHTRAIVDTWLCANRDLFRNVNTLYNSKNLGTSISVDNMLALMVADRCKLTAGDDLYSYENIFELTQYGDDIAIISGMTLPLIDDALRVDRLANLFAVASQLIYRNTTLLHRFKHFSYNNAPNIAYATQCLMDPRVRDYLKSFDVIEDWPIQIAIARQFPDFQFRLINKVLVYYRRTKGSTYIVANKRFIKDKIKIYDDLIYQEKRFMERLRLISRKNCFKGQNRLINKILNIDFYCFLFSSASNLFNIIKKSTININLIKHQNHYNYIHSSAIKKRKVMGELN